jgi:hypothetical protein
MHGVMSGDLLLHLLFLHSSLISRSDSLYF